MRIFCDVEKGKYFATGVREARWRSIPCRWARRARYLRALQHGLLDSERNNSSSKYNNLALGFLNTLASYNKIFLLLLRIPLLYLVASGVGVGELVARADLVAIVGESLCSLAVHTLYLPLRHFRFVELLLRENGFEVCTAELLL